MGVIKDLTGQVVNYGKTHGNQRWVGFWNLSTRTRVALVIAVVLLIVGLIMLVRGNAPVGETVLNEEFPRSNVVEVDEENVIFVSPGKEKNDQICSYHFAVHVGLLGNTWVELTLDPTTATHFFGNDAKVETRKDGDYWTITDPTPRQAWEFVQKHVQDYAESCNLEHLQGKGSDGKKDK